MTAPCAVRKKELPPLRAAYRTSKFHCPWLASKCSGSRARLALAWAALLSLPGAARAGIAHIDSKKRLRNTESPEMDSLAVHHVGYSSVMKQRILALAIAMPLIAVVADTTTVEPKDLAAQLQSNAAKPALIHVGFAVLYRGKHI